MNANLEKIMTTYRWRSPQEWLIEHIGELEDAGDIATMASIVRDIILSCDADEIQDLFQKEMEQDGYFRPIAS